MVRAAHRFACDSEPCPRFRRVPLARFAFGEIERRLEGSDVRQTDRNVDSATQTRVRTQLTGFPTPSCARLPALEELSRVAPKKPCFAVLDTCTRTSRTGERSRKDAKVLSLANLERIAPFGETRETFAGRSRRAKDRGLAAGFRRVGSPRFFDLGSLGHAARGIPIGSPPRFDYALLSSSAGRS